MPQNLHTVHGIWTCSVIFTVVCSVHIWGMWSWVGYVAGLGCCLLSSMQLFVSNPMMHPLALTLPFIFILKNIKTWHHNVHIPHKIGHVIGWMKVMSYSAHLDGPERLFFHLLYLLGLSLRLNLHRAFNFLCTPDSTREH